MATDWAPYAEHMREVADASPWFERLDDTGAREASGGRPETKFERRGLRLGHEVRDLLYRRNDTQLSPQTPG
jgi:tRNA (guanine-N7-)-methyltransferase